MNLFDSKSLKGLELAFANLKEEVCVDLREEPESENLNLLKVAIEKAEMAIKDLDGVESPSFGQIAELMAHQFFVEYLLDEEDGDEEGFDEEFDEEASLDMESCCDSSEKPKNSCC